MHKSNAILGIFRLMHQNVNKYAIGLKLTFGIWQSACYLWRGGDDKFERMFLI